VDEKRQAGLRVCRVTDISELVQLLLNVFEVRGRDNGIQIIEPVGIGSGESYLASVDRLRSRKRHAWRQPRQRKNQTNPRQGHTRDL
jgi:hypothetical protein